MRTSAPCQLQGYLTGQALSQEQAGLALLDLFPYFVLSKCHHWKQKHNGRHLPVSADEVTVSCEVSFCLRELCSSRFSELTLACLQLPPRPVHHTLSFYQIQQQCDLWLPAILRHSRVLVVNVAQHSGRTTTKLKSNITILNLAYS